MQRLDKLFLKSYYLSGISVIEQLIYLVTLTLRLTCFKKNPSWAMTIIFCCYSCRSTINKYGPSGGFRGGRRGRSPPPLKSAKKKKKCSNFAIFPFLVVKNAKFSWLASLANVIYNIIIDILVLKNSVNNTFSYILPSFYTGEGNFDMKMQDLWAKIAKFHELPRGFAHLWITVWFWSGFGPHADPRPRLENTTDGERESRNGGVFSGSCVDVLGV